MSAKTPKPWPKWLRSCAALVGFAIWFAWAVSMVWLIIRFIGPLFTTQWGEQVRLIVNGQAEWYEISKPLIGSALFLGIFGFVAWLPITIADHLIAESGWLNHHGLLRHLTDLDWTEPGSTHHQRVPVAVVGPADYPKYLSSPQWQLMRDIKLDAADHRCALCYSNHRLQVHHRTYERIGNEDLDDLIVLCNDCHAKFHNKLP